MYLNAHSYYSLRYGTLSVKELVSQCRAKGHRAAALTDINNSTGALMFVKECNEHGIKPIVGMEFRDGDRLLYTAIVRNNSGFRQLNEFITCHNLSGEPLPARPALDHCYLIYPLGAYRKELLKENEFTGIRPHELNRMVTEKNLSKFVMFPSLTFADAQGYELHRQLRAIDRNILISRLKQEQYCRGDEKLLSADELRQLYSPFFPLVRNAEMIIDDCRFDFDFTTLKNRQTFTGSRYDDKLLLEKLACGGMKYRYGENHAEAERRIRLELEIIDHFGFSSYFLITWDIIRYSMSRGFYHVGRGSGANSVVAYCLNITDVCPIELNLSFERFLNPKRKTAPDFDIDYSWKERDDVFAYIFKSYGHEHTALLGVTATFKDKSILRELGKVYGLPKNEIDRLVEEPADVLNNHDITDRIRSFKKFIADFPNIRSIHAGGVLISEEPITCYTALDLPPKNFQTAQIDMYTAEEIGFEKLDILSQRGIGHIKDAADIILRNRAIKIDVHDVACFKKDEKVRQQLKSGDTTGCFYIESPGMRGLLKKLQCGNYLSLVAASSVIRPGVAGSGMMREFIWRFHNPGKFQYLHPVMEEQLHETYGVMVYQEDVLKVCHHFAGLDLADADVLRRMMSGKGRNRAAVQKIKDKFFLNCKERGYPEQVTAEVWRQIESFAGYSFSKAHSASYAVESFQSLYLKAYYPLEFIVAVINNFGGFYTTRVYVHEAKRSGASIHLPCVNNSLFTTTIYGKDIYLGFIHIQNLENNIAQLIFRERERNGTYCDLENFILRTGITLEQLIILVRINALRFTGKPKKRLLWEAHLLLNRHSPLPSSASLFAVPRTEYALPQFSSDPIEDAYDEIELLGFPVTLSAFDLLQTKFRGEIMGKDMLDNVGKTVRMVGSFVHAKYVRTKRGGIMNFGTFLDAEGNFFDTTHFPPTLQHSPFRGSGIYLIRGKVTEEFGFASLDVDRMAKLPVMADPRSE